VMHKLLIRSARKRTELQLQLVQSQLSSIKSQMNPHFIFNCIYSIYHLVLEEKFKETNIYIGKFGNILRSILEHSEVDQIPLTQEIRILEDYLDLEKLRFKSDFIYRIIIDISNEDKERISLPPMLIQPFVENAIKHGLINKAGMKNLTIHFKITGSFISVRIEDNGVGRLSTQHNKAQEHCSFSTKAIEKRIKLLNSTCQERISAMTSDLMNSKSESGTKVLIMIPLNQSLVYEKREIQ